MHATKHAQIGSQRRPHPFTGVGMRLARAIPIRIACPFPRRVTHGGMWSLNRGVAVVFIGVDVCSWPGKLLDMRPQGGLLRIRHHPQPHLTAHAPDRPQYWRPVVSEGTAPTPFIGSRARRVGRVEMLGAFFAGVLEQLIALGRAIGQSGVRPEPFRLRTQAMAPFQDGFLGQVQFAGQVRTGLALEDAAQQQDQPGWPQLAAFKDRTAIERVDPLTGAAAIHRQPTAAIDAKDARLLQVRLTMRTAKSVGMEMLLDPRLAGIGVK